MVDTIKSFGIQPKRTSFQCPWQNGIAERFVGNCRRDLLGHVLVVTRTARNSASAKKLLPDPRPKRILRPIANSFRSRDWEACIIDTASPRSRCYVAL